MYTIYLCLQNNVVTWLIYHLMFKDEFRLLTDVMLLLQVCCRSIVCLQLFSFIYRVSMHEPRHIRSLAKTGEEKKNLSEIFLMFSVSFRLSSSVEGK